MGYPLGASSSSASSGANPVTSVSGGGAGVNVVHRRPKNHDRLSKKTHEIATHRHSAPPGSLDQFKLPINSNFGGKSSEFLAQTKQPQPNRRKSATANNSNSSSKFGSNQKFREIDFSSHKKNSSKSMNISQNYYIVCINEID